MFLLVSAHRQVVACSSVGAWIRVAVVDEVLTIGASVASWTQALVSSLSRLVNALTDSTRLIGAIVDLH